MFLVGFIVLGLNPEGRKTLVKLTLPIGMAMLLGVVGLYPYVGARQEIYLTPFLFLIVCAGFDYVFRIDPKMVVAFSVIILMLRVYAIQTVEFLRSTGIQNLRPLIHVLEEEYVQTDEIYVCPAGLPSFRYYFNGAQQNVLYQGEGEEWRSILEDALATPSRLWIVWVGQCGNESTYTDFVEARREIELRADDFQASLYLVP